ncbi:hypothetical protein B0T16DRAFT_456927 [Cercophora newfieldiana]|uniref:Uncharacterized protein n=1 Tax=Cercophora newfieldiana TaxID=92897 RepID=A0AA40CSE9_9PEZI|nr:hypothetical protein B0T16DRAFT_456927 [Cercophora newfieldiana]
MADRAGALRLNIQAVHFKNLKANSSRQKLDFLSVMRVSRNCSCKDPRDKIYALLGLAAEDSRPPIKADYGSEATTSSVYVQLATWHVSSTFTPKILEHIEGLSPNEGMPSWVPDWTILGPKSPLPPVPQTGLSLAPAIVPFSETPICKALQETESLSHAIAAGESSKDVANKGSSSSSELYDEQRRLREHNARAEALTRRLSLKSLDGPVLRLRGWRAGHTHLLGLMSRQNIVRNGNPKGVLGSKIDGENQPPFWEAIWLRIMSQKDRKIHAERKQRLIMDLTRPVPVAFGGPCEGCLAPQSKNLWSEHFHADLEDFLHQLQLYGEGRSLFATEYSLGFGHQSMVNGDEVWVVDRVSVPLILRPISDHLVGEARPNIVYTVIGSCYVYAVTRMVDECLWCATSYRRERVYSLARQERDGLAPTSDTHHQSKQTIELV